MPTGKADISFTSDETDLVKGQAKVIRQQDEMIQGYKKMLREAKKAAKDGGTELERFARKTNQINKAPAQRYREEMEKLNRALKAGLINQETYNRAVDRLGRKHRSALGGAVGRVAALGTQFLGLTAIVGGVTRGISEMRNEIDRLGEQQAQDAPGLGELAQLAETPEDFRRMVAEAKKTRARGGAKSLGEAGELQFALESAGIASYRADVADLQATGTVRDATSLVNAAAALEAALGTAETGTFRDIVSKGFGASKVSPARMEEIVQAAALSGSQGKALGLQDEELLAAVASISKVTGSAGTAGTQVESLLKQIEKFGIAGGYLDSGKSLQEQVASIKQLVDDGTDIRDVLGDRQEGIKAFRQLSEAEGSALYQEAFRNVVNAERTDAFGRKVRLSQSIPELSAFQAKEQAQARAELAGSETATYEQLADAVSSDLVAQARQDHG